MSRNPSASLRKAEEAPAGPPAAAPKAVSPVPGRAADQPATLSELSHELDARVCSLHRLADALRGRVEETRQEGAVVDLAKIEERAHAICLMRGLHAELQKLTALVAKNGIAAEALHRAEIKAAQEGLSRAQTRAGDAQRLAAAAAAAPDANQESAAATNGRRNSAVGVWGLAQSNGSGAPKVAWAKLAATPPAPRPPISAQTPARRLVPVVGEVAVEAVVLPATLKSRAEVYANIAPGDVYYVPQWNHFAMRVGPCVFHGNLGRVYPGAPPKSAGLVAREAPVRVKECRRTRCQGGGGCPYYHDPETYPGSGDVRNFMADSWRYTPAASPAQYGTRRIGSADYLEADLRVIGAEEARRFMNQTAHDLLCSLILWQYVLAPAERTAHQKSGQAGRGKRAVVAPK